MSDDKEMGFAERVGRLVLFPLSWIDNAATERKRRKQQQLEAEQAAEQQRIDAERRAEQQQHMRELEEKRNEEAARIEAEKADSLARGERARYQCQLLYDRFQYKIGDKFPQSKLEKYFDEYLKDEFAASVIERRAEDLKEMIMSFVDEPKEKLTSRVEVKEFFEKERQDAYAANLPSDVLEATISELNAREDQAMMDLLDRQ